jgi:hypothetical protein
VLAQPRRSELNSIISLAAGAALLVGAGAANANEPIKLTDAQMDNVTAGFAIVREVVDPVTGLTIVEVDFDLRIRVLVDFIGTLLPIPPIDIDP